MVLVVVTALAGCELCAIGRGWKGVNVRWDGVGEGACAERGEGDGVRESS